MAHVNTELRTLFNQVDDWFTDITLDKPVSQFSLGGDQTKLELISRKTLSWFKSLSNPTVTNDGLELDNSDVELEDVVPQSRSNSSDNELINKRPRKLHHQNANNKNIITNNNCNKSKLLSVAKCRNGVQKRPGKVSSNVNDLQTLDSLAKDLELLLEDDGDQDADPSSTKHQKDEHEFYFYNSYKNEELALLDDSIGYCCTLTLNNKPELKRKLSSSRANKEFSVVMPSSDYNYERKINSNLQNEDLNRPQISMPLDHDYLPKPRAKPLVLSNKLLSQCVRINNKESSVLNTEAIKRFAPFSDRFRKLSMKHDGRLLAIENT